MSTDSSTPSRPAAAQRTTLMIVFVVVFIDLLGFGIVLPLLPRYGLYFRASLATLGLLMASFSAMQFLFAPLWGSLSDRIGRRPVLLIGLLGSAVSYALFGYVTGLERDALILGLGPVSWLFITRIGAGIAGATIATAQAVIADSTAENARGKGMALIGAAFGIGFTFGPLIGAAATSDAPGLALSDAQLTEIAAWESVEQTVTRQQVASELLQVAPEGNEFSSSENAALDRYFQEPRTRGEVRAALLEPPSGVPGYIAAALSLCAFLFALARLPESHPQDARQSTTTRGFHVGVLFRHLRTSRFTTILIGMFVTTFAFAQFESTLSLLTREFGYGNTSNFLFFAYIGFVLIIAQGFLVRRLIPQLGERRMALIGVTLMVGGFVLLAMATSGLISGAMLWILLPVVTVGVSAVTPSLQSLLSLAAEADEQGAVLGTGQSLSSLARILGPYLGIQLLAVSTATPYYLAAGLMVISGLQIARLPASAHAGHDHS